MKAVVFDRDGVLASFDLRRAASCLEPLLPFDLAELEARMRRWHSTAPGGADVWPRFVRHLAGDRALPALDVDALLAVVPQTFLVAHADARPALEAVRTAGARTAVLSNFGLLDLEASLVALELAPLVDVSRSAAQLGHAKPHPEAYLAIARALCVDPAGCLFLDDRDDCVAGARAVGMAAVRIDRSGRTPGAWSSLAPLFGNDASRRQ
jgi:putative hydrolase of the HAD superfamily